ncbi:fatty acid desaturase [Puniceibacterium sp. IMCC21224]|uniref:fatty acid desaturase n=1 Tax=Puniceibacterium sp. IMCC21224 TaxID=1618204 RepID=UPI00064DCF0F|nr:fatty acid desaturase [Puniceibacterium sp. IMCC21224]KMK65712.1 fatty acid desaturase [Puniceibacterium sp. IMCC21224]
MQASFSRRSLIAPDRLRALMQRSDLRGGLQLGGHLGALCLTGAVLWQLWGSWWAVPVFMAHGVLINFLYAGQHELSHETVFRTKPLNALFGRIFGFVLIYPRDFDKIQHWAHHQHTQNWEKDGELVREPYTLRTYLLWFWGLTYWQTRVTRIVRFCRGVVVEPYIRPDENRIVIREARIHAALYATIAGVSLVTGSWAAVILWLAPMMLMKPVHQLQNTIEHLGLSHKNDILENTRSTRANAILRWLCWQMPYHTAHHTFPAVPFWQLGQLDAVMRENGAAPHAMGWIEFQIEVIRKLRAKSEADYPYDEVWIVPRGDGRSQRVEAT